MTATADQLLDFTTSTKVTVTTGRLSFTADPETPEPDDGDGMTGFEITREINANPEEVESLRRSVQQAQEGEVRWLADDENLDDVIG